MKRFIFSILTLIISFAVGYHVLCLWKSVSLYQTHPSILNPSKDDLLRASRLEPSNPDPHYRLGLFYLWNIGDVDLEQSFDHLKKAIERNPLQQEYWLTLAGVLSRMGKPKTSDEVLERAISVFPAGYAGRWAAGNLLLQRGDYERALPHFSYILAHYPDQSSLVYDIFLRAKNADFVLENLVPKDRASFDQYLHYLYEIGDQEAAVKTWDKKVSLGYKSDRQDTLQHIDFLISRGLLGEAFRVWGARLKEEGLLIPSDHNLITNGRFEVEKVLGGGFDWRIEKVPGAEVSFDRSVAFEGKGSLRIHFDGKENIDFYHVFQYVAWKPDTDYLLRAYLKTKGITTKSGLRIEAVGIGPAFYSASESLTGDNGWKELRLAFHTPAHSQGGIIRARREKTDKFDRLISGTVWLDDVTLKERQWAIGKRL